jgi:predicted ATPase
VAITLEARNYRGLRHLSWSPSGVCALVGPNGSGKTTALSLVQFFQDAFRKGLSAAIESQGGPWRIRNLRAGPEEPVRLALAVGELRWELQLGIRGSSIDPRPGERVTQGSEVLIERAMYSGRTTSHVGPLRLADNDPHLALPLIHQIDFPASLDPLVAALNSFRVFLCYDLLALRRQGSKVGGDLALHANGENAFTVLNNWHGRREYRERFEFVRDGLRAAFPELSTEIDFEMTSTTVSVRMHLPGANPNDGVPAYFTPNGWLIGLLHLCAVAGAEPGSLVAIDEVENSLHPFAIRKLIEHFRKWAYEHDLTICLATHSPVVLDQFKEEPENIFVMEPGQATLPIRLTDLEDREWLAQFSLGDLYTHGDFGSPPSAIPKLEPAK